MVESFEQMEVWQKAHALTLLVYKETQKLPEEEEFGLILQMRQAAVRVPGLIANGFGRRLMRSKLHMYSDAQAMLDELRYYFRLCTDLGYEVNHEELAYQGDQLSRMTLGLVRSIARRAHEEGGGGGGGGGGRRRGRGGRGRGRGSDRGERRDYSGVGDSAEPMDQHDDGVDLGPEPGRDLDIGDEQQQ